MVQTYDLERHFTASVGGRGRTVRVVVEGGPVRHDFPQACEALGRGQALFFLVVANSLLLTALTRRDRVNPLALRVHAAETEARLCLKRLHGPPGLAAPTSVRVRLRIAA